MLIALINNIIHTYIAFFVYLYRFENIISPLLYYYYIIIRTIRITHKMLINKIGNVFCNFFKI